MSDETVRVLTEMQNERSPQESTLSFDTRDLGAGPWTFKIDYERRDAERAALTDALTRLTTLTAENARLTRAGYVLAMELLQSPAWATADDEVLAAANQFLPQSLKEATP